MCYLEDLDLRTIKANTLQNFLDELHEPVMEYWLIEFYVSEMALALSTFAASLAFLV